MASLSYSPRSDASTAHETAALASVYAFVLSCHEAKKEAAPESRPDDAERSENACTEFKYSR